MQTRLEKLAAGEFDAIMLAQAGILRLQMHDVRRATLSLDEMLPAPGQGALGIEVRSDDQESLEALAALDHCSTRASVTAERQLLAALHGGCLAPIAAFAELSDQTLRMRAVVLSKDGTARIDEQHQVAFDPSRWEQAASELASHVTTALVNRGASELIQDQRP